MSDDIQPTSAAEGEAPTEPVVVPVAAAIASAAPAPDPAPTPAAPATLAAPAGVAPAPSASDKRRPILGLAAQIAGIIGILLFLGLAVGVVIGRSWAIDTVDEVTTSVEAKIDKVVPLLDTASSKVSEVQGRVGAVADAAASLATQANAAPGLGLGLTGPIANLADRYNGLRATYGDVREKVISAIDSIKLLARFIPGFTVPQGPIDALDALDAKVTEVDAAITGLADAVSGSGPIATVATAVADKAGKAETALGTVSGTITDVQARVAELEAQVTSISVTARTAINLGSVLAVLLFAWIALLHWVLFRAGRTMRRGPSGS